MQAKYKLIIAIILLLFINITNSLGQGNVKTELTKTEKFILLQQKSGNIILPDSIYTILKKYALKNNLNEASVLKNSIILYALFNNAISKQERLEYVDFVISFFSVEKLPMLPIELLKDFKNWLLKLS